VARPGGTFPPGQAEADHATVPVPHRRAGQRLPEFGIAAAVLLRGRPHDHAVHPFGFRRAGAVAVEGLVEGVGLPTSDGVVNAAVVDNTEMLLAAVAAWARQRPDVHAAFVVGSHARAEVPADRWSDIDIVFLVDDPTAYTADTGWLATFGRPLLTFVEPTAVGGFIEQRVLFDSGQDVDFALLPLIELEQIASSPDIAAVLGRGLRVLVDKRGLERALRRDGTPAAPAPPSAATFAQLTHDFWYHALWAAKKLRRGEVWIAKQSCDCYLKALMVRLLAWHAQAADREIDTWHGGRFLERWADRQALQDLRDTYANYDADDVARALWATVNLFERLEHECAERLDLALTVPHHDIREHLRAVLG
jgi:aminoglycoside 6-adenylyltransferase